MKQGCWLGLLPQPSSTHHRPTNAFRMIQQKIEKQYLVINWLRNLLISKFGLNGFEIEVRSCEAGGLSQD